MIVLKTAKELAIMREACRISAGALKLVGSAVEPGVTTAELDKLAEDYIRAQGAIPFESVTILDAVNRVGNRTKCHLMELTFYSMRRKSMFIYEGK